jgi:hypothetical protein
VARSSDRDGYRLVPDEIAQRVETLTALGAATGELVAAAGRLAERLPMLGTAPPAQHLAARLRDAAGPAGLTGAVEAANAELASFHDALAATVTRYQDGDTDVEWTVRGASS